MAQSARMSAVKEPKYIEVATILQCNGSRDEDIEQNADLCGPCLPRALLQEFFKIGVEILCI